MNAVFKNVFTNKHTVVFSDKHLPVFIAQTHLENTLLCLSRGMRLHLNTKLYDTKVMLSTNEEYNLK